MSFPISIYEEKGVSIIHIFFKYWHIVGNRPWYMTERIPTQPQFSYRQLSMRITICVPDRNDLNRERPGDRPVCSPRQKGRAIARYRVSVYTTWAGALPCQQQEAARSPMRATRQGKMAESSHNRPLPDRPSGLTHMAQGRGERKTVCVRERPKEKWKNVC